MPTMIVERSSDKSCDRDGKRVTRWAALAELRLNNETRRTTVFCKCARSMACLSTKLRNGLLQDPSTPLQQMVQLGAVETHDHFTVYHCHGRRHVTELFQFHQRGLISHDISFGVLDLVLRKKLFHFSAKHSAGLAVHDHFSTRQNPP